MLIKKNKIPGIACRVAASSNKSVHQTGKADNLFSQRRFANTSPAYEVYFFSGW